MALDDDDDAVSLASTIDGEDDEEKEFSVERIIGERICFDGVRRWLVRWEDYPLQDATWEPFENLDGAPDAVSEWEGLKLAIQRHEVKSMVPQWVKEVQDTTWAKWRRHLERNDERKKRGLDTTAWPEHPKDMCRNIATQWLSESDVEAASESSDECPDVTQLDSPTTADQSESNMTLKRRLRMIADAMSDGCHPARLADSTNEQPPNNKTNMAEMGLGNATAGGQVSESTARLDNPSMPKSRVDSGRQKPSLFQQRLTKSGSHSGGNKSTALIKGQVTKTGQTAIRGNPTRSFVNVFAGGKMPIKRAAKTEDHSQVRGGKISSLQYQNRMKKSSRDKENAAPPSIPRSLRPLAPEKAGIAPYRTAASRALDANETKVGEVKTPEALPAQESPPNPKPPFPSRSSIKPTKPIAESFDTAAGGASKLPNKKKTVRFGEKPMEEFPIHEASLFIEDGGSESRGQTGTCSPSPPTPSLLPLFPPDQHRTGAPSQPILTENLLKTCTLGANSSSQLSLLFHEVPRPKAAWADALQSHSPLLFTYACHASDYISQFAGLDSQKVASGYISAPVDYERLETITARLKRDSRGMFCHTEDFCVIIYPSKSEEWEEVDQREIQNRQGPIKYILYGSACFQKSELPQYSPNIVQDSLIGANLRSFLHLEVGKRIYPLEKAPKSSELQVYIAFPRSAMEQAKLMVLWIRSVYNSDCTFLGVDDPAGDWANFLHCQQGALIIHEEAMRRVRLFPNMFQVLKRSSRGEIAVSIFDRALASSISMTMWATKRPTLGNLGLRKIASTGAVFLLSPSFIVTCPKECRGFLKWFWGHHISEKLVMRVKLAIPTGIIEWIEDIALNKLIRRECSIQDEDDLSSCINTLTALLRDSPVDGETDSSDILKPLALAPENIDPSDEQSLVNWFGWWTSTILDKYCSFYVVGSGGPEYGNVDPTIHVKPVRWEKGTAVELHVPPRNHKQVHSQQGHSEHGHATDHGTRSLQLVGSDSWRDLENYLKRIYSLLKKSYRPMFLCYRPVGYKDSGMAFDLGDHGGGFTRFATYREWFESFFPLSETLRRYPIGSPILKHTLTGLFYTPEAYPDKPGDNDSFRPELHRPERHSWIAMFRPCNPDRQLWNQSELFIWDQRYQGKVNVGQNLYEGDLLQVHRDFIENVGQGNNQRNPNQVLAKVWLGGWDAWRSPYSHPLDITLDRLGLFADTTERADDLRRWVPYWEADLEKAGWTMIKPESSRPQPMQSGKPQPPVDGSHPNAPERAHVKQGDEDEWDPEARMLFHAPPKKGAVTYSNTFFLTTNNRSKLGQDGRFIHRYVPTKLWYNQQASQGQGYAHVMVDTWKNIFEELRILRR